MGKCSCQTHSFSALSRVSQTSVLKFGVIYFNKCRYWSVLNSGVCAYTGNSYHVPFFVSIHSTSVMLLMEVSGPYDVSRILFWQNAVVNILLCINIYGVLTVAFSQSKRHFSVCSFPIRTFSLRISGVGVIKESTPGFFQFAKFRIKWEI